MSLPEIRLVICPCGKTHPTLDEAILCAKKRLADLQEGDESKAR